MIRPCQKGDYLRSHHSPKYGAKNYAQHKAFLDALGGTPLHSDTVACLDYSIAKGGKLVAYRWDGEPLLDAAKFRWVGP